MHLVMTCGSGCCCFIQAYNCYTE